MSPLFIFGLLLVGIVAGYLSGLVGVGGGIIIVPALIYVFGFSQLEAQGTTLALLVPPIGFLAALEYYKRGYVDIKIAGIIIVGFIFGSFIGGKTAIALPEQFIKKLFACIMAIIAVKMLFFDK